MLARAFFYPSLLYNIILETISSRQWYTRIDDTVILGALPFRSMTSQLVDSENVKAVVTLNEKYETRHFVNSEEEWSAVGVAQTRLETVDLFYAPSLAQLQSGVDVILRYRGDPDASVYVHCKAGRSRSATVVACYLMKVHGWSPDEAVQFIKEHRSHILIREPQWRALHDYHKTLVKTEQA